MTGGLQRRLATGSNAFLVAALVVAIVGVAVDVAGRTAIRWDLSEDGLSTLEAETLSVVTRVEERDVGIEITAFTAQAKNQEAFHKDRMMRDFLADLDRASPRIRTRLVNFDLDRLTADRLGIDRYGTVVIEGNADRVDIIDREIYRHVGKERRLEFYGESAIISGIERILADDARTIYTLDGHGELQVFDRGLGDLKEIATLIDSQGWTAKTLDLLKRRDDAVAPEVPPDAAAVLVLGARAPLAPIEAEALRSYVGGGGSVAFFLDQGLYFPDLLEELGLTMPDGMTLDTRWTYPHQDRPRLQYRSHPITAELVQWGVPTVVGGAGALRVTPVEGVDATEVLLTSRSGWIERGSERPAVLTPDEDVPGPVTVAAALTVRRPHPTIRKGFARVLAVADMDVVGDELLAEGAGNATFVTNSLRWLVRADDRMSRIGKPTQTRKLAMTPTQLRWIQVFVAGVMPLLSILVGTIVWFTRRNR